MEFELPDQLPATVAELSALAARAQAEINVIQARHAAYEAGVGAELTTDDVARLEYLADADEAITTALAAATTSESEAGDRLTRALARTTRPEAPVAEVVEDAPADEPEDGDDGGEAEVVAVAEAIVDEAASVTAGAPDFTGVANGAPPVTDAPAPGWEMANTSPGYRPGQGRVGFRELSLAIDSVRPGSRGARRPSGSKGGYDTQVLARLPRDVEVAEDRHALVAAIEHATSERRLEGGSLTAAGGWCAPSEQLYDFCDVPDATDLLSVPEITINRGGVRWPVEPDLSVIYSEFQFFFTEPDLEAVDGNGDPTAVKHCVEIPCPDTFVELRLNAVGYCVEAGILQDQGWPEVTEWFMRSLAQEHLRAISRRTILNIVAGSGTPKVIANGTVIGATAGVLNSLALQATNLRLNRGLSRSTTIEGIAPSWFYEVLRADLAMQQGLETYNVTDAQIDNWLRARNIALQFVGDWQTRDDGLPGNLATVRWPGHVDVVLYPAGTWFRAMQNVIELGVMYPKEQLQVNRYTRFFTEDAIAVGKRCNNSIVARIPLEVDGAVGARKTLSWTDTTFDSGAPISGAPIPSGQVGLPGSKTLTVTGTPTGGSIPGDYDGDAFTIPFNATAASLKTLIVAASEDLSNDDVTITGGPLPGTALVIKVPEKSKLTIGTHALTGGTTPAATLA